MITHWDEVEGDRRERGHIAASWQPLTGAHSVTAGVQRISIDPGRWATPLHLEGSEEEIFYVLSGHRCLRAVGRREGRGVRGRRRATVSSIWRSSTRTRSAPGTRASSCSPSGSGTTPRTRCCRGPASRGSVRPGCSRARPRTTLGARGRRRAADLGRACRSGRRASSTSPTSTSPSTSVRPSPARGRDLGRAAGSERTGLAHLRRRRPGS